MVKSCCIWSFPVTPGFWIRNMKNVEEPSIAEDIRCVGLLFPFSLTSSWMKNMRNMKRLSSGLRRHLSSLKQSYILQLPDVENIPLSFAFGKISPGDQMQTLLRFICITMSIIEVYIQSETKQLSYLQQQQRLKRCKNSGFRVGRLESISI